MGSVSVPVKSDTVSPTACHSEDVLSQMCCPGVKPRIWAPPLVIRVQWRFDSTSFLIFRKTRYMKQKCLTSFYLKPTSKLILFHGRSSFVLDSSVLWLRKQLNLDSSRFKQPWDIHMGSQVSQWPDIVLFCSFSLLVVTIGGGSWGARGPGPPAFFHEGPRGGP